MKTEKDDYLVQRYPAIFAERHGDRTQTAMCWGFQHGDGWLDLLDVLCQQLQAQTAQGAPQVVAYQVREKYGLLRFEVHQASERQRGMIAMAQAMSGRICELCGQPGTTDTAAGWIMTRCTEHAGIWRLLSEAGRAAVDAFLDAHGVAGLNREHFYREAERNGARLVLDAPYTADRLPHILGLAPEHFV